MYDGVFLFIEIFIHQFIFHLCSFLHSIVVVVVVWYGFKKAYAQTPSANSL